MIYGVGFAAVNLLFAALYLHAYRQRDDLAQVLPEPVTAIAGFIYFGIAIPKFVLGSMRGRRPRAVARIAS